MKLRELRLVIFVFLIYAFPSYAVTLVYNLKVRRIFNIPVVLERIKHRLPFSVVPIYFTRTSNIIDERTNLDVCEKRRAGGMLLNQRFIPGKHWWFEMTTGIETDHGTFTGTKNFHAQRAGLDDIVFEMGYRHFIGKKGQAVLYGLAGFPTRRKITLCDQFGPLVGTRLYNLGFGFEGSYSFKDELRRSVALIGQGRFIHGFDRNWFPILPKGSKIQPGNVTDLLFTFQYREKRTIFETGYNPTFFTNQALIFPTQKIKVDSFVRHSFYASLQHVWLKGLFGKSTIIGTGFNINKSKKFDTTSITAWVFGTLVF